MTITLSLSRLGALGMVLGAGVFFQISSDLGQDPSLWLGTLILLGFPVLCGGILLRVKAGDFTGHDRKLMFLSHGMALIALFWILLWCFVWLALLSNRPNAEMLIKHTAYLHLFGVGFTMAGYATGWMATRTGERSARFFMGVGWAVSYASWFTLYFEPKVTFLWAPAIGGLLVVLGAFIVERQLKREVEAGS